MLQDIYLTCFFIGCIYTAVAFILGGITDILDFDIDLPDFLDIFHFDLDLPEIPDVHTSLPIKPFIIVAFITVFGGLGSILLLIPFFESNPFFTIPISAIVSFLVSTALYRLIYLPLLKLQTTVKKQSAAIGIEATVLETILPGSYGRISYKIDSNILSAPAKEMFPKDGIKKGELVIIKDIKDNVFYVTRV